MANLEKQMQNYRLTTAEILYHMPDHPSILQSYVWQDYDIDPAFPVLNKFLNFWVDKIEGKLHSIYVASTSIITPSEMRMVDGEWHMQ
ncbi:MAG: usg protein [Alphaproteobacteria bacterium]